MTYVECGSSYMRTEYTGEDEEEFQRQSSVCSPLVPCLEDLASSAHPRTPRTPLRTPAHCPPWDPMSGRSAARSTQRPTSGATRARGLARRRAAGVGRQPASARQQHRGPGRCCSPRHKMPFNSIHEDLYEVLSSVECSSEQYLPVPTGDVPGPRKRGVGGGACARQRGLRRVMRAIGAQQKRRDVRR